MEKNLPSGIKEASDGSKFVGGSVRADGTVRKTYKVRPGYTPPEDVAKYVPRAKRLQALEKEKSSNGLQVAKSQADISVESDKKNVGSSVLSQPKTQITNTQNSTEKTDTFKDKKEVGKIDIKNQVDTVEKLLDGLSINDDKKTTPTASSAKPVYIPPWKRKQTESSAQK